MEPAEEYPLFTSPKLKSKLPWTMQILLLNRACRFLSYTHCRIFGSSIVPYSKGEILSHDH
eukprot:c28991_g1_i1 orf=2-181(-)